MTQKMPKLGNMANPAENTLEEIEKIGKLGFDFAEISIEGPKAFPENLRRNKAKILQALKKYRMFIVGHTMWWNDMGSPYEHVRQGWVRESEKAIDIASELGIKLVNFHFDSVPSMLMKESRTRKKILDNYVKSLNELVAYGKGRGVGVMLENGASSKDFSDVATYRYVVDKVKGLGVHLDVGHAFIHGGMKNVLKFISTFKKRIVHVHIHDNYGKRDDHLPLGVARIEYESVIKALKKIGYRNTITFEVFTRDRDLAAYSMKKFRDAWNSKR
jgi:sugar phosphate isomerase/epimerase